MARVRSVAARVWLDPDFGGGDLLPAYPARGGSWPDLFAAIEVEGGEHALKRVRLKLSRWRKPSSGWSSDARAAFDMCVRAIDEEIVELNRFAHGEPADHRAGPARSLLADTCEQARWFAGLRWDDTGRHRRLRRQAAAELDWLVEAVSNDPVLTPHDPQLERRLNCLVRLWREMDLPVALSAEQFLDDLGRWRASVTSGPDPNP